MTHNQELPNPWPTLKAERGNAVSLLREPPAPDEWEPPLWRGSRAAKRSAMLDATLCGVPFPVKRVDVSDEHQRAMLERYGGGRLAAHAWRP